MKITLITGGAPHYEAGLVAALLEQNLTIDLIGHTYPDMAVAQRDPRIVFIKYLEIFPSHCSAWLKLWKVMKVYLRLIRYATTTDSRLFHIQWPYKLVFFDRTFLNLYYKVMGKKLVFTAHNVDGDARDGRQSWWNRFSLWFMYRIVDHIIVHTDRMKSELIQDFGMTGSKISVIPHGIMSAVPESPLSRQEARERLGLGGESRVILAFGLIAPYKGLEYLVEALGRLRKENKHFTLLIAGRIKECQDYWDKIHNLMEREELTDMVVTHLRHIPDNEVEIYFKAADVLAIPYRSIFQSGVLFLAYRFGLPVVATDVGSLKEDVVAGKSGFICKVDDAADLAKTIETYFQSELFADLENRRQTIREEAFARYSWSAIGEQTRQVYESVMEG